MAPEEARHYWDDKGLLLLWLSVVSGPAAWALNQLIGYALVKPLCAADAGVTLSALGAGAFAITVGGAWIAWRCLRRLKDADSMAATREGRSQLLAVGGLSLNLLLGLLILTAAVAPFLLSPCE
jgi:hypothetical protein